jgi:hypothetical protein
MAVERDSLSTAPPGQPILDAPRRSTSDVPTPLGKLGSPFLEANPVFIYLLVFILRLLSTPQGELGLDLCCRLHL